MIFPRKACEDLEKSGKFANFAGRMTEQRQIDT